MSGPAAAPRNRANPADTIIRMRRSTFALFDQMHRAKNAELGVPLSRGQMLDIVVSSAAAVLATKVEEKPPAKPPD